MSPLFFGASMVQSKYEVYGFLCVMIVVFLTAAIYWPGMKGPFVFDDFHNLEPLGSSGSVLTLQEAARFAFGNNSGPTGRPVSMASFLLDDNSWPPASSISFKKTNLAFHLATGLLVFLVALRLIKFYFPVSSNLGINVAIVVSALWLVHPLNTSVVLYVIQRMAILSAFFSLLSIYFYLIFRTESVLGPLSKALLLCFSVIFLTLGVFSKENALLVLVFLAGLEVYRYKDDYFIFANGKMLFVSLVMLSVVLFFLLETYDVWGRGYQHRVFDLWDRLISQIIALGEYIRKIIIPDVSSINLFRGEFEYYPSVPFSPLLWVNGIIVLVFLSCFLNLSRHSITPVRAVLWTGIFWFFCFHLMESTIFPLELYFEHRNYLPSVGILMFLGLGLVFLKLSKSMRVIIISAIFILFSFQTFLLAKTWSAPGQIFLKWEMDEPKSVRAKVAYANLLYMQGFPKNAAEHIERAMDYAPYSMRLKFHYLFYSCIPETGIPYQAAIKKFESHNQFDIGTAAMAKQFWENLLEGKFPNCSEKDINMGSLFKDIETSEFFGLHRNLTVQHYALKSDYYKNKGNLNEAMLALEEAISITPTHALYLKSADLLVSAGLYRLALDKLEQALTIDMKGSKKFSSRDGEILARIRFLRRMIDSEL